MTSRPLIKESLRVLHICGLDPHRRDTFSNFRTVLSAIVLFGVCIDVALGCILNWKNLSNADGVAIAIALFQLIAKLSTMVVHRERIAKVLRTMEEEFWPVNIYGSETQHEIEAIYKTGRAFLKCLPLAVLGAGIMYIFQPIFGTTRKLPFQSYHPVDLNQSPDYELTYAIHSLCTFVAVTCHIGFDCFFVSIIINIVCEFKILSKGFEKIPINANISGDTKESLDELYKLVDHHNLVLSCTKKINEIYSTLLLNFFFFNEVCICFGLLAIVSLGFPPSLQVTFKYALFVSVYVIQLFFYCIAGSFLTAESDNISTAIYNTNWYVKTQPKLRKAYVMVIRRANKAETLTAGGMFDLDLDSFTRVCKSSLSFFTVIEALYSGK